MVREIKLNDEMLNSIILSIKPHYSDLILSGEKVYEFRNFKPKNFTSYFWVYESVPSKELKYIIKIKNPIIFPNEVSGESYGTERFNSGEMKNKYAYKIEKIYLIKKPLSMKFLKEEYNFTPPQAYTYLYNNTELKSYLEKNIELIEVDRKSLLRLNQIKP